MTLNRFSFAPRALAAAAVLVSAAAAQAAGGVSVNSFQETLVTPGMSEAAVQQALGRPARIIHYSNEPGPTFTYNLEGTEGVAFDVDFDSSGHVASTSERATELDYSA
jgi:hypothetical protein